MTSVNSNTIVIDLSPNGLVGGYGRFPLPSVFLPAKVGIIDKTSPINSSDYFENHPTDNSKLIVSPEYLRITTRSKDASIEDVFTYNNDHYEVNFDYYIFLVKLALYRLSPCYTESIIELIDIETVDYKLNGYDTNVNMLISTYPTEKECDFVKHIDLLASLGIGNFQLVPRSTLISLAFERASSTVIEIFNYVTTVTPVLDAFPIYSSERVYNFGVSYITNKIMKKMMELEPEQFPKNIDMFTSFRLSEYFLSLLDDKNHFHLNEEPLPITSSIELESFLIDCRRCEPLNDLRPEFRIKHNIGADAYILPECFFQPSFQSEFNITDGLHHIVYNSIMSLEREDARVQLFENILIAGENSLLIEKRLNSDLSKLERLHNVRVTGDKNGLGLRHLKSKDVCFLGASILVSSLLYENMWMKLDEWNNADIDAKEEMIREKTF